MRVGGFPQGDTGAGHIPRACPAYLEEGLPKMLGAPRLSVACTGPQGELPQPWACRKTPSPPVSWPEDIAVSFPPHPRRAWRRQNWRSSGYGWAGPSVDTCWGPCAFPSAPLHHGGIRTPWMEDSRLPILLFLPPMHPGVPCCKPWGEEGHGSLSLGRPYPMDAPLPCFLEMVTKSRPLKHLSRVVKTYIPSHIHHPVCATFQRSGPRLHPGPHFTDRKLRQRAQGATSFTLTWWGDFREGACFYEGSRAL